MFEHRLPCALTCALLAVALAGCVTGPDYQRIGSGATGAPAIRLGRDRLSGRARRRTRGAEQPRPARASADRHGDGARQRLSDAGRWLGCAGCAVTALPGNSSCQPVCCAGCFRPCWVNIRSGFSRVCSRLNADVAEPKLFVSKAAFHRTEFSITVIRRSCRLCICAPKAEQLLLYFREHPTDDSEAIESWLFGHGKCNIAKLLAG